MPIQVGLHNPPEDLKTRYHIKQVHLNFYQLLLLSLVGVVGGNQFGEDGEDHLAEQLDLNHQELVHFMFCPDYFLFNVGYPDL